MVGRSEKSNQITVEGVVTPWQWDGDEAVVSVAITADDGTDYIVTSPAAVRQLGRHINDRIEVNGVVDEDEDGEIVLNMEDFSVFDDDDDDDWDVDDDLNVDDYLNVDDDLDLDDDLVVVDGSDWGDVDDRDDGGW